MKKLSTLFKKNPENLGRVINEVDPRNYWAIIGYGIPTRKFDGTACAIIQGELHKRYDPKVNKNTGKSKPIPEGAIPCQDADKITGHWPHWVKCDRNNPQDKWHWVGFDKLFNQDSEVCDGTYELCGEKIQSNPEKIEGYKLIPHGVDVLRIPYLTFEGIKTYLENHDIEGIVFYHTNDDRMCKIRKSDFGIKR